MVDEVIVVGPNRPQITSMKAELRNGSAVVTLTGVGEVPAGSVTIRILIEPSSSTPSQRSHNDGPWQARLRRRL